LNINLRKAGERSLLESEISRVTQSRKRQEARRDRSQFSAEVSGYDANQGHAIAQTDAGTFYARSITTQALSRVALSLPRKATIGTADAKPV
jgi:hypothetical protein